MKIPAAGKFVVAAVSDRRDLLNQKSAVRDRRDNKTERPTNRIPGGLTNTVVRCRRNSCCTVLAATLLTVLSTLPPTASAWGGAKDPIPMAGAATIPAGTILYLHLKTAVSTKTSKPGQAVSATLVREVATPAGIALPPGSILKGVIEKCAEPTTSEERAELLVNFGQIDVPGEGTLRLKGRVSEIGNARESLLADGTIVGVRQSEAPVSLLGGVLQKLGQIDPSINDQIQKQKIGQVNTSIEYPAGADFQFTLLEPLTVRQIFASTGPPRLPFGLRASVEGVLASAPQRAVSKDQKPGDPINLVFVGTAQEIRQAFQQAGWAEPKKKNQSSILKTAEAVMNNDGYGAAPVSNLYLFGRKEDLAFEKTLNTFNKRHHLRLWQSPTTAPDGRPIWLGAATHDIGIDVHPGVVSHATDPNLDDERAQVGSDIVAGGAAQAAELVAPPNPLSSGMTATGGEWHTDGRLLVVDLKTGVAGPM